MKNYLIIIEKNKSQFSAYAPDVPGCIAAGNTPEEALENMQEALGLYIKTLIEDGFPVPEPITQSAYATV